MKNKILLIIIIIPALVIAQKKQKKLLGQYINYFGETIIIRPDSTFFYTWGFDTQRSWSSGKWTIEKDTIFFKTIPIYDTIRFTDTKGKLTDSLILSGDEKSNLYTSFAASSFSWQNRHPAGDKLFYKNQKLFGITSSGRVYKSRNKEFWTRKKSKSWYFKPRNNQQNKILGINKEMASISFKD